MSFPDDDDVLFLNGFVFQGRGHGPSGGRGGRFTGGRGMGGGRGGARAQAWDAVDRSKQLCVFFAQGKCTKGDKCPFSHTTSVEGVSQAAEPADTIQRAQIAGAQVRPTEQGSRSSAPAISNSETPVAPRSDRDRTHGTGIDQNSDVKRTAAPRRTGEAPPPRQSSTFRGAPLTSGPPVVYGSNGKQYMMGPDGAVPLEAVIRTLDAGQGGGTSSPVAPSSPVQEQQHGTSHGSRDRSGAASAKHTADSPPGQTGIITLPDGGFVTRKRAAELQLLRGGPGKELRRARPREGRVQEKSQQRGRGLPDGRGSPLDSRVSIMDRLGPAKKAQDKIPPRERPAAFANIRPEERRAVPVGIRQDAPVPPPLKQEEPRHRSRQLGQPRNSLQMSAPSPLSRSQGLGATRPERGQESARRSGVSSLQGQVVKLTTERKPTERKPTERKPTERKPTERKPIERKPIERKPTERKPAVLNFKVTTLDEIKSRKAKAEAAVVQASTNAKGTSAGGERINVPLERVTRDVDSETPAVVEDAQTSVPHIDPVSIIAPVIHSSPPQLDAADMDEFGEWL